MMQQSHMGDGVSQWAVLAIMCDEEWWVGLNLAKIVP